MIKEEVEKHICGLCNKEFTITERLEEHHMTCSIEYFPKKIELIDRLPSQYPLKFICADCQPKLKDKLILHYYDIDSWWVEIYIFESLDKFYKDFPGIKWIREEKEYNYFYSKPPIYRILEVYKNYPPILRFYSDDKRIFEAIQEMPTKYV